MNLDQWKELLNDVKPGNGSTEGDLLEQIKKKLEKQDHDTYKKWEHENFHENHIFTVPLTVGNHQKGTPPVTLLYLAAEAGNIELIGYLIEEKHVDSQSHRFYKLHPIVQHRICQVNRLIEIEKHVDPNLENNSKEQQSFLSKLTDILIHSIKSERFEIVEYILGRVSKTSCSATREIYTKALIDDKITKELDSKIGKQKEEHAKYERWTKLKEKLVKNNELLTQDMHSIDRNNNLGKETISLNEEGQKLKSTDSRQPQKNVVDNRKSIMDNKDASKEQCISNNYKVDEMHDSNQDTNSIEEKLKSNGAEVTATLAGGSVGDINATASNKTTPIDADDKEKQTPNQSVEDQKVAPPDVEQVHKNGEDKFLDAQNSNKEDTGKLEVFESEAQYAEKIKELNQELNRRATQVDTLTRELENKSKKLHNAKKEVRKFSKAISELREVLGKKVQELASEKEEYIDKLAKKEKELQDLKKQLNELYLDEETSEEIKELQDLEKQLNELCLDEETSEEISKLTRFIRELKRDRGLAVAQKLEQEERFKQAQHEINNLKEKLEREQKLHSDTVNKAHDQSRQYKAQLAEKEKALIDSRKSAQELEQVIENLNGQIVKFGEERDFILAQKLEQGD